MMAQEFQDLTGQVIKKMMEVIREVERQLMHVLLESVPEGEERDALIKRLEEGGAVDSDQSKEDPLLNGPQIHTGSDDVVSSQDQVDDLLDQLGF